MGEPAFIFGRHDTNHRRSRPTPTIPGHANIRVLKVQEGDRSPNFKNIHVSNEKRAPDWLGYIGDYTILPNYTGIIINHEIRIPINQPGWLHGK